MMAHANSLVANIAEGCRATEIMMLDPRWIQRNIANVPDGWASSIVCVLSPASVNQEWGGVVDVRFWRDGHGHVYRTSCVAGCFTRVPDEHADQLLKGGSIRVHRIEDVIRWLERRTMFLVHDWSEKLGTFRQNLQRCYSGRVDFVRSDSLIPLFHDLFLQGHRTRTYVFLDTDSDAEASIVKIGISSNVNTRLQRVSAASGRVLKTIAIVGVDIESRLHVTLDRYRLPGEWFRVPSNVLAMLRDPKMSDPDRWFFDLEREVRPSR